MPEDEWSKVVIEYQTRNTTRNTVYVFIYINLSLQREAENRCKANVYDTLVEL